MYASISHSHKLVNARGHTQSYRMYSIASLHLKCMCTVFMLCFVFVELVVLMPFSREKRKNRFANLFSH